MSPASIRGKKATVWACAAGISMLAVAVVALRRNMLEWYQLHVLASDTTPLPEPAAEDLEWRRLFEMRNDLSFPKGVMASEIVRVLDRLMPFRFRLEEVDSSLRLDRKLQFRDVTLDEFLATLLTRLSEEARDDLVCALSNGSIVIGPRDALTAPRLLDWRDVGELLGSDCEVGFPVFKQSMAIDERNLAKLVWYRVGNESLGSGLSVVNGRIAIWGEREFHDSVATALEWIRQQR